MRATTKDSLALPAARRGRRSAAQEAAYQAQLQAFADRLQEIASRLDFKVSSRGWCYILEEHGLAKGDFDRAQKLINDCRKRGLLPLDFTVEDESRTAENLEDLDDEDLRAHADFLARWFLNQAEKYEPVSFWDFQDVYIEVLVEKIDLKQLFLPVCKEYHAPIANAKGWSDINGRAQQIKRFREQEGKGRRCVLLYCGDFDPVGLRISETYRDNLRELEAAAGWSPENLVIERFGLNYEFIEQEGLSWIDNIETGSGKDLADPEHPDHEKPYVQDYLRQYGARKVEANALVVRAEAGRQLCRDAIEKYLNLDRISHYEEGLAEARGRLAEELPKAMRRALRRNEGNRP